METPYYYKTPPCNYSSIFYAAPNMQLIRNTSLSYSL